MSPFKIQSYPSLEILQPCSWFKKIYSRRVLEFLMQNIHISGHFGGGGGQGSY